MPSKGASLFIKFILNMRLTGLFSFAFIMYSLEIFAQDGGNRQTDMLLDYRNTRGKVGTSLTDEKAFNYFMNVKTGPYLENSWFTGKVKTTSGAVYDKDLLLRYDILNQNLHHTTKDKAAIRQFPEGLIQEFYLETEGRLRKFSRIPEGSLEKAFNECVYVENLIHKELDGKKFELVKASIGEEIRYTPKPPAGDGKPVLKYASKDALYYRYGNEQLKRLRKVRSKEITKIIPSIKNDIEAYENEEGKIRSEMELVQFLKSLK